ncbi:hypothetical protein EMPG_16535 [Blastomyces silverae]|uniref:U3 small nucleolar RNA-associated protein 11 n=1 Tax=Blastomyces silverae TaxID=2060906 RepID=A0A0H1B981_9EURO|nr:hypothetical protein EMPG_16535 [Blastomyces silverae]
MGYPRETQGENFIFDYSLRARDYNVKKAKLQRLREKARDRNPDEFAFGMMSEKSNRQGRHGARGSEAATLSHEAIKLLKTQDAGYLRVVGEKVRRQLEGVEQEVRLQDGMNGVLQGDTGRKIVFADSLEEQRRLRIQRGETKDEDADSEEEQFEDGEASFGEKQKQAPKKKKEIEAEERARKEMLAARRLKKRAAEVRRKKVEALQIQHKELVAAEQELDRQRAKMENSVGGVNKDGIKWKIRERKK